MMIEVELTGEQLLAVVEACQLQAERDARGARAAVELAGSEVDEVAADGYGDDAAAYATSAARLVRVAARLDRAYQGGAA